MCRFPALHPCQRALCLAALEARGPIPYACLVTRTTPEGNTLNADRHSPGTDNTAERGRSGPASQPTTARQALREIRGGVVAMWWGFFDWLAIVSWKMLLLVSFLSLILAGGILKHPTPAFFLIVASFIIKAVAGGKRKAELTASEATKRADTEQLERTVLEARMEALQAQIEPHFLFNTLASIDQLIQTDPPRASRMQQSLIRYLRSAMPQMRDGGRPTLGQQADLCSAFLEIMAVRMEGRLQPLVKVPEGLKSAVFPSMMLQTLVENAIKHGLEPKPEGGRLEIGAEVADGQLAVHVLDTGVGFMPKDEGGVGLTNVRERLKALYNGRAELIITVPPAGGTCATIKVPYETAPAATPA
jgi:signal transduction histidine kinase